MKNILKTVLPAIALIIVLQLTGAMGTVSYYANAALLKTGIMNASPESDPQPEDFNFNFKIKNLAGEEVDFNQFKGKVIFINLWATWCGPCRAEMPSIQKLHDSLNNDRIAFVMLSLDKDSDLPKIKNYVKKYAFTFPVYQPKGYLSDQLNVSSIPTTLIINKEGKIVSKEVGSTNFNTKKFKKYLEDLAN